MSSTFGNWTVYTDIPVPFTCRVLIIDLGRHSCIGWRYKSDWPTLRAKVLEKNYSSTTH